MRALTNMNMQSTDMMIIPLRFFMKENRMMIIPQPMKMTNNAGAMLEYNIATSQPKVEVSKNRYSTVNPMNIPSMA